MYILTLSYQEKRFKAFIVLKSVSHLLARVSDSIARAVTFAFFI